MCFSDTLAEAQPLLEAGEKLLLTVDIEQKEDEPRFTIKSIEKLDENLSDKMAEIRLVVDNVEAIKALKDMLAEEADSAVNTSYSLEFEIDKNRIVRVKLAGGYPFTPDIRSNLYRLNGIADIREL